MTENIQIPITNPKTLGMLWRLVGAADVLAALRDAEKSYGKLPGLGMAIATAEAHEAGIRAAMSGAVIRDAARAGYDITRHNIFTSISGDKPVIELRPFDLTDLAEAG